MAAPILGPIGGVFIFVVGMTYLDRRRRSAAAAGEGYGLVHFNEPEPVGSHSLVSPYLAFLPVAIVASTNIVFTFLIPRWYGASTTLALTPNAKPLALDVSRLVGIWAVEGALVLGTATVW